MVNFAEGGTIHAAQLQFMSEGQFMREAQFMAKPIHAAGNSCPKDNSCAAGVIHSQRVLLAYRKIIR